MNQKKRGTREKIINYPHNARTSHTIRIMKRLYTKVNTHMENWYSYQTKDNTGGNLLPTIYHQKLFAHHGSVKLWSRLKMYFRPKFVSNRMIFLTLIAYEFRLQDGNSYSIMTNVFKIPGQNSCLENDFRSNGKNAFWTLRLCQMYFSHDLERIFVAMLTSIIIYAQPKSRRPNTMS